MLMLNSPSHSSNEEVPPPTLEVVVIVACALAPAPRVLALPPPVHRGLGSSLARGQASGAPRVADLRFIGSATKVLKVEKQTLAASTVGRRRKGNKATEAKTRAWGRLERKQAGNSWSWRIGIC